MECAVVVRRCGLLSVAVTNSIAKSNGGVKADLAGLPVHSPSLGESGWELKAAA